MKIRVNHLINWYLPLFMSFKELKLFKIMI